MESISPHDWLSLAHPVLMILFVYPVFGATVRLGILAREKRLDLNPIADTVPIEHAQHAAWAVGGILVAIPIALSVSLLKTTSPLHAGVGRWGGAVQLQQSFKDQADWATPGLGRHQLDRTLTARTPTGR